LLDPNPAPIYGQKQNINKSRHIHIKIVKKYVGVA